MITVMLAVSRAKRVGVDCRIEDNRHLVFSRDGQDIGSTLIDGDLVDENNDLVSEHAVSLILRFKDA